MRTLLITTVSASILAANSLFASLSVPDKYIPQVGIVGKARLQVLFWKVFDATLYAPDAQYDPDQPFALSLSYLRSLDSDDIVNTSIDEITKQGAISKETLDQWAQDMRSIFPDVRKGDVITGVQDDSGNALFYLNGYRIGQVNDSEFASAFFSIWLGEKASRPTIRQRLLGEQTT